MRIRTVKKDYSDLCLNVPINILGVFAGDFDGRRNCRLKNSLIAGTAC